MAATGRQPKKSADESAHSKFLRNLSLVSRNT